MPFCSSKWKVRKFSCFWGAQRILQPPAFTLGVRELSDVAETSASSSFGRGSRCNARRQGRYCDHTRDREVGQAELSGTTVLSLEGGSQPTSPPHWTWCLGRQLAAPRRGAGSSRSRSFCPINRAAFASLLWLHERGHVTPCNGCRGAAAEQHRAPRLGTEFGAELGEDHPGEDGEGAPGQKCPAAPQAVLTLTQKCDAKWQGGTAQRGLVREGP